MSGFSPRPALVRTDEFDYELPPELIAQTPLPRRDDARLLVLERGSRAWRHCFFRDLPELLRPGDVLVRNNSRVVAARLVGRRVATGGRWEGLFLRQCDSSEREWLILARTRGRTRAGEWVEVEGGLRIQLLMRTRDGAWVVRPDSNEDAFDLLERFGRVPLPPYIHKGEGLGGDRTRYQTEYAREPGSVAAPTAGLHFTTELLERLSERGVAIVDVTLHVGLGTFRPIESDELEGHTMHSEWARLGGEAAAVINSRRAFGGRVVAVGSTSLRTLESAAAGGSLAAFEGETSLFITPGHAFRAADVLITNFHLPRSTLLVLTCAFGGTGLVREAYREAIKRGYRFYSYGDAMMII